MVRSPSSIETAKPHSAPVDLEALLQGDHAAFEDLVRQESPRLFRVLVRLLRDEEEARSVMQETFLQAYERLPTFRREARLTTWLYAIGINLARSALRRRRRLDSLSEADVDRLQPHYSRGLFAEPPQLWDPQQVAERTERQKLVRDAIDRLPPDYRLALVLRDLEGLSTAETASVLEISEGALRVRLHRARQALRGLLNPYFGSP